MENKKSLKLIYCILGSLMLVLLRTSVFHSAIFGILDIVMGKNIFKSIIYMLSALISFGGIVLVVIFSVMLILENNPFRKDK